VPHVETVDLNLIGDFKQLPSANDDCRQAVLDAYTTAMKHLFLREAQAFDSAASVYRARNPGVSLEAARRAVAGIICGTI
jgi:hypothetical protein